MHRKIGPYFSRIMALPPVYLVPLLALCLLLQLQVSVFKTDDYLGLRLSAADFLLPALGLLIGIRLLLKRDRLPQWRLHGMYYWLAALAVLMTFALINGYSTTGAWDRWAIINKYAGFFVLLAYLGCGGWIVSRPLTEWQGGVTSAFTAIWVIILAATLACIIWFDFQKNIDHIRIYYPLSAFMGNRNAFAFLSFCALAFLTATHIRRTYKFSPLLYLSWGLMPLFYIYNASRAGIIILPLLFIIFLILNPKITLKTILPALLVGTIFIYASSSFISSYVMNTTLWHTKNAGMLVETGWAEGILTAEEAQKELRYEGDQVRAKTYNDALALWSQNKITGGGLGSFHHYQLQTRGQYSDVIDSTPLWLLAETGIIGFLLFSGLFLTALWRLFSKTRADNDPHGIYLGIFLMLLIFGIMSLVHELLYTRFIWFFMGLGLALPPEERKGA